MRYLVSLFVKICCEAGPVMMTNPSYAWLFLATYSSSCVKVFEMDFCPPQFAKNSHSAPGEAVRRPPY